MLMWVGQEYCRVINTQTLFITCSNQALLATITDKCNYAMCTCGMHYCQT